MPTTEFDIFVFWFTGLVLVLNIIFFFRLTFLPFARFVGGVEMILKKLLPFIIVSVLLLLAFVYGFWINKNDECDTFRDCIFWALGNFISNSIESRELDDHPQGMVLEFFFMFAILIVLLNVVIAIVSDAWEASTDKSTQLFWKFRLEKIHWLGFVENLWSHSNCSSINMCWVDNMWTSFGSSDISFWEQAPYNLVTKKIHYDRPPSAFGKKMIEQINSVKSLHSDLYWAKSEKSGELTWIEKFVIVLKWLGTCVGYGALVVLGFITGGLLWPKKFRLAVLTSEYFHNHESNSKNGNDMRERADSIVD